MITNYIDFKETMSKINSPIEEIAKESKSKMGELAAANHNQYQEWLQRARKEYAKQNHKRPHKEIF